MATKRGASIVGFIHVCMINDFMGILKEQIKLMVDSGLYNAMNCANICCLGGEPELDEVREYIKQYGKLQLGPWSKSLKSYEFHTLSFMQEVILRSSSDFYGFYIHSKGVSWPGHPGGKYWRDYMNYYNITKWKDAVANLDLGYETCGVKLLNKEWPMHYSGNFFWYKASYAASLVGVNRMNLKDRFNAEMWICSGRPIAATLCQDFVDYNTEGVFDPHPELCKEKCLSPKTE
jgi:hypothetical protein